MIIVYTGNDFIQEIRPKRNGRPFFANYYGLINAKETAKETNDATRVQTVGGAIYNQMMDKRG